MLIQCRHSERGEKTLLPYTGAAEPKESERERSDGEGKLLERKATKPASNTCDPRPRLLSQFRSLVARGALFLSCSNTHLKRFLFAGAKAEPKRFREECEWRPRFFSSSLRPRPSFFFSLFSFSFHGTENRTLHLHLFFFTENRGN